MADIADVKKNGETVEVPLKVLTDMQEQLSRLEANETEREAQMAGLKEALETSQGAATIGEPKLREKKNFEPKFRQLRLRKYPIAGDRDNMGIVSGWTSRGAYQEVDTTGVARTIVDYIDIIFLGHEKTKEGKIKAEKVRLLDFLNNGVQEWFKILEVKVEQRPEPTNEEIDVSVWDPQHGLVSTGEKVDGYTMYTDRTYKIAVPGHGEVWVDAEFANK